MNAWDQIKRELQSALTAESYENWVSRTRFHRIDDDLLVVSVPDETTKRWLETEYSNQVNTIIRRLHLSLRGVEYAAGADADAVPRYQRPADTAHHDLDGTPPQLNPKFTFDSFVVGACNQFAHAAARSV